MDDQTVIAKINYSTYASEIILKILLEDIHVLIIIICQSCKDYLPVPHLQFMSKQAGVNYKDWEKNII